MALRAVGVLDDERAGAKVMAGGVEVGLRRLHGHAREAEAKRHHVVVAGVIDYHRRSRLPDDAARRRHMTLHRRHRLLEDRRISDLASTSSQHLNRGVDRSHRSRVACKFAGEYPGSASEFEGVSGGLQLIDERIRSRLDDKSLVRTVLFERAKDYRPYNRPEWQEVNGSGIRAVDL